MTSKILLAAFAATLLQGSLAFSQNRPPRYPDDGGGVRPGPIRPGPERPGPGRPGPVRPGPDRPGPVRPGPERPGPVRPDPRPVPRPPDNGYYGEATVQFYGVTRQVGGEWLRVGFNRISTVESVQVNIWRAGAIIHEAYAITDRGYRIPLNQLFRNGRLYNGSTVTEFLGSRDRISAIDLRIESMGGYADINVRVSSREGTPYIYPTR